MDTLTITKEMKKCVQRGRKGTLQRSTVNAGLDDKWRYSDKIMKTLKI